MSQINSKEIMLGLMLNIYCVNGLLVIFKNEDFILLNLDLNNKT